MAEGIKYEITAVDKFSKVFSDAKNGLDSMTKAAEGFKIAGTALIGTGTALATGLGAMVKTAADFEKGMSRVGALARASDEDLEKLTATAKQLGAETVFSASEAADGMSFLAQAGYKTNEIVAAMPGLLDTAAAAQSDLGVTADIVSNILSGFGLEADETGRVADVLTLAFTSSNTSLESLGNTMKYVAPIANASGQSLEMMAAAAGILGDSGIQSSQAGTALRAAIVRLVKPPEQAAAALENLGVNVADNEGKMKPLSQIVRELTSATEGMTEADKLATIAKITGTEAASAFITLMDAGADTLEEFTHELENSGGVAQEVADRQLDNLHGQLTLLKSGVEGMAISIGEALIPSIGKLVGYIQQAVEWFNGLDESTKETIAQVTALSAVVSILGGGFLVLLGFLPQIVSGFNSVMTAGKALGSGLTFLATNPVGLIIAAVAALVAGIVIAYNKIDWFREFVDEAWEFIKEVFVVALEIILETVTEVFNFISEFIMDILDGLAEFWAEHGEQIIATVTSVFNFIKDTISTIINAVVTFIKKMLDKLFAFWEENGEQIKEATKIAFTWIKEFITTTINAIKAIFDAVFPVIKAFIEATWNNIKGITEVVWSGIQKAIDSVMNIIMGIIKTVTSLIRGDWRGVWNGILDILKGVWGLIEATVSTVIGVVSTTIKNGLNIIKQAFFSIWNSIAERTDAIFTGIGESIKAAVNFVIGVINKFIDKINSIKIKVPSISIPFVGTFGGFTIGLPQVPNIPSLDVGTNYVQGDGLAMIHEGEAVVPKRYNPAAGGASEGGGSPIIINAQYVDRQALERFAVEIGRIQGRAIGGKR